MFSFNFYFTDSNIMGSVADWAMVLVTAVTAVYLIKTFRDQQLLKKIEQLRYIDSIMPSYKIEVQSPLYESSGPEVILNLIFLISNLNTIGTSITLTVRSDNCWKFYKNLEDPQIQFPLEMDSITQFPLIGNYYGGETFTNVSFLIIYFDKVGNKYAQGHVYSFDKNVHEIKSSIPVISDEPILNI